MAEITIRDMRVNHIENPVGYEMSAQTFSWKYEGDCAGEKYPKACRVMVARDSSFTDVVSDSGFSLEVSGRAYCLSLPLAPRTRYYWRAEAQLAAGGVIRSDVSFFETGKYLEAWQGRWIRLDAEEKEHTEPFEADLLHIRERAASPVARRAFAVAKEISAARLYVTGLGLYECYVNGVCANDGYLQPGFNHYNYWQQYQTFDVTGLLRRGENVLAFLMGDGWYKGRFGVNGGFEQNFGAHMHLLCELRISYADGTEELVASDGRFRCAEGPVKFSSIYDGEVYDASAQPQGAHIDAALDESTAGQPFWMCPGFDDSGWRNAKEQAPEKPGKLTERYSLPVVVKETLKPQAVLSGEDGAVILDMGQNMTGWLVFRDMLKPQQQVRVRFAELLKDGRLCTDNLLSSAGTSFMYTSDGAGRLVRPHFTYFGFRYAELSGFPEDVRAEDFEGWCLYSDLPGIGQLATGNAGVNRLISNILWSQRGNFLEHPTDCPQRAERLGWTGDAQIYCRTAGYFMDTAAFFRKYLKDVNEEQAHRGGIVPFIIPKIRGRGFSDPNAVECSAAWSDVATVMPWTLYVFGGDKNLLAEHYAGMKAWADYMAGEDEREGGNFLWKSGFHFGDWLALDNPEPGPFGKTDPFYIASAYYYYSTSLTAKAACVLGMDEDAERYGERAKKIRKAVQREYFDADGICRIGTQTAYAVAIYMELTDRVDENGRLLAQKIRENGMHLDTGFVGTPYLCPALTKSGQHETAVDLLLQEDAPGWLNEVRLGATTIWEAWDALDARGHLTGDASLNHYAYGSVAEWMYADLCGIRPTEDAPGFARARIEPKPSERLGSASASVDTASGVYRAAWRCEGRTVSVDITVPFAGTALLCLPEAGIREELSAGTYHYTYEDC